MVSAPKATPRVSVNQVAPRPSAAAISSVKHEPNNRRMPHLSDLDFRLIAARRGHGIAVGRRRETLSIRLPRSGVARTSRRRADRAGATLPAVTRVIGIVQHMLDLDERIGALARQQDRVRRLAAFERRVDGGRRM